MRLESAAFYQQFQESDYSNSEWYYNCMARILVEEAMITSNLLAVKFMKLHEVLLEKLILILIFYHKIDLSIFIFTLHLLRFHNMLLIA